MACEGGGDQGAPSWTDAAEGKVDEPEHVGIQPIVGGVEVAEGMACFGEAAGRVDRWNLCMAMELSADLAANKGLHREREVRGFAEEVAVDVEGWDVRSA